jgi:hypothetical protein
VIIDSSARQAIILDEGGKFSNDKGEWELNGHGGVKFKV